MSADSDNKSRASLDSIKKILGHDLTEDDMSIIDAVDELMKMDSSPAMKVMSSVLGTTISLSRQLNTLLCDEIVHVLKKFETAKENDPNLEHMMGLADALLWTKDLSDKVLMQSNDAFIAACEREVPDIGKKLRDGYNNIVASIAKEDAGALADVPAFTQVPAARGNKLPN